MRLEYNLRMIKEKTTSAFLLQASIKVGELYFSLFLDNDISFRRIIQIILAIVSVLGQRGAGFQVLKKILAEWLIS